MKNYYLPFQVGLGFAALAQQYFNNSGSSTVTVQKKKKKRNMTNGTEWRRSRRTTRLQKASFRKKLYGASQTLIDRYQGLTNFDTNSGYSALCYRKQYVDPSLQPCVLPIHVFDLTTWGNSNAVVGQILGWENTTSSTSNIYRAPKYAQPADGEKPVSPGAAVVNFVTEKGEVTAVNPPSHACLDWVDLRFNLYGARKRDTYFRIQIVRFKDEFADLFQAGASNGSVKELLTELERPLIYNNLQAGQWHEVQSRMQVIRSFYYKVPAKTADDLNTATGNIQEAKIFMKVNKACNYMWDKGNENFKHDTVEQGRDFETEGNLLNDTHRLRPQSRLYLLVSAFCPKLRTPDTAGWFQYSDHEADMGTDVHPVGFAVDIDYEPSYDFLFRRKWTLPSPVYM